MEILPMSKPIGYYTSYTPGDGSALEELQEMYGSSLEQITHREKLFLISSLASQLCITKPGEVRASIQVISVGIVEELKPADIEGLIAALVDQVRRDKDNAELIHHA
jgi:hypothetical protein